MRISMIAAVARNNAIGFQNKLLYWLPDDLKRFKSLTTGNTIIMGRKTFESLPKGALPNRRNVVLTRNRDFFADGIEVFASMQEALEACKEDEEVFVIGGASVYAEAMPLADRLCLTYIEDTPKEADAFFPEWQQGEWRTTFDFPHSIDEKHTFPFRFLNLERVKK